DVLEVVSRGRSARGVAGTRCTISNVTCLILSQELCCHSLESFSTATSSKGICLSFCDATVMVPQCLPAFSITGLIAIWVLGIVCIIAIIKVCHMCCFLVKNRRFCNLEEGLIN